VSAAGATLSPPQKDASHTSLVWIEERRAMACAALEPTSCRAALRLGDMHLLVLDGERRIVAEHALADRTIAEATSWLGAQIADARAKPPVELIRPSHDLPDHPVAHGRVFDTPTIELEELARWFGNAWQILSALAREAEESPSVRIWPHHFDTA